VLPKILYLVNKTTNGIIIAKVYTGKDQNISTEISIEALNKKI